MADENNEVWRWNVNDVWETFSSMVHESHLSNESSNLFIKHHHLSATLLFGACCLESFLNSQLRSKLEEEVDEDKIFKRLRKTSFKNKLDYWPQEICGEKLKEEDKEAILELLWLRNEVTHRKNRDHSLHEHLCSADSNHIVESVRKIMLSVIFGKGDPFPYWLLGWNFVGFNHDSTYPCLMGNVQFLQALRNTGFDVPSVVYGEVNSWINKFMTVQKGYDAIKNDVYENFPLIEPKPIGFKKPLLCKRWWDKEVILALE